MTGLVLDRLEVDWLTDLVGGFGIGSFDIGWRLGAAIGIVWGGLC